MNKFEQVSSDGHQMSLAGVGAGARGVPCLEGAWGRGQRGSHVPCLERRGLYNEVHCIMGKGHMGPPPVNRMMGRYD